MTRRQPPSSRGSEASYVVDVEAARTENAELTSPHPQRHIPHPLGSSPPSQPPTSTQVDPLGSESDIVGDNDPQFILVNGQLFPKPAIPTDAPPPYAPYPAGRARAQTFTAGSPLVALPPLPQYRRESAPGGTETTPLLGADPLQRARYRSPLEYIIKGDEHGYSSTLWDGAAWKSLFHTLVINFPFNLALWPLLLTGTLVGTALLVTLPLGAVFWFATLILARAAAAVETRFQAFFQGVEVRSVHPIFYRQRVREDGELVWDRRFLSCWWSMFTDQYSYSALVYLLLIKPAIVLVSFVALLVLFILSFVFFPFLPIFLRFARAFGRWQAHIALDNL